MPQETDRGWRHRICYEVTKVGAEDSGGSSEKDLPIIFPGRL